MRSMFKKLLLTAALGSTMAIFAGCGDTITNTTTSANVPGTLQGKVMDATTGKPIVNDPTKPDDNIKMYLIKGTQTSSADKADFSSTSDLAGEYAFSNIPVSKAGSDSNAVFKIVVVKNGYQRFESEFSFTGMDIKYPIANDPTLVYGVYNKIGNIYLYPTGATAADYTVTAKYNAKAVPGAVVQLVQQIELNDGVTDQQGGISGDLNAGADNHRLFPSKGLMPTLTATTDANGKAVFKGTDLVLGGQYTPVVQPVKTPAEDGGLQLAAKVGSAFVEGTNNLLVVNSSVSQTINLNLATAATSTTGLYIAAVDNTSSGVLRSSGVLTITFSRPVELNNSATANVVTGAAAPFNSVIFGYAATLTGNPSTTLLTAALNNVDVTTATGAALKPVTAALSADGLTLTLTPSFKTAAAATDFDLAITYAAGVSAGTVTFIEPTISIKGAPEKQFSLFGSSATQLLKADGTTIVGSTKVNMIGPRI